MQGKTKSKLCWNCEGSAPFETENCPYCGVYLSPQSLGNDQDTQNLFAPPYRLTESEEEPDEANEAPPYTSFKEATTTASRAFDETASTTPRSTHPFLSLAAVLAGFVFLLFALALALFAEDGLLTLRWNSHYWYLYLAIALPLLGWGWYDIEKQRDE